MPGPLKSGQTLYKNLGSIINNSTRDNLKNLTGKLLSGRILNIDQSGTTLNGSAKVQVLDEIQLGGANILVNVLPLFPNLKNYPLINETVLVIALANKEYKDNFNNLTFYYISPLNLWNNNQSNPLPYPTDDITSSTQNKDYLEVDTIGNPNKPSQTDNTTFKPGTYFDENQIYNPTYPYEGDYIIDGRFGNSIRLGNTVPNTTATIQNNWSSTGSIGDPITILTNKKHKQYPLFNSITEDINKDGSSIYLTSTQKIPIEVSSQNSYLSYGPTQTQPKTVSSTIKKTKKITFPSGDTGQNVNLNGQLAEIISLANRNTNTIVRIVGSESQVPNPPNSPQGSLATIRANNVKSLFPTDITINISTQVGNTPFISGTDNPNDPKYTNEQFVEVTLTQRIDRTISPPPKELPIIPNQYIGEQIILNSGRLVFNSNQDHILISSKKSINLNTVESVNIDAATKTVIQTPELYLGGIETAQPVVLGNDLVDLLGKILTDLEYLTGTLQNQLGVPVGSPIGPTNLVAQAINDKIGGYKAELSNILSNTTKTV